MPGLGQVWYVRAADGGAARSVRNGDGAVVMPNAVADLSCFVVDVPVLCGGSEGELKDLNFYLTAGDEDEAAYDVYGTVRVRVLPSKFPTQLKVRRAWTTN